MKKIICGLSLSVALSTLAYAQQVTYHFEAKAISRENSPVCSSGSNTILGTVSYNAHSNAHSIDLFDRPHPFDHFTSFIGPSFDSPISHLSDGGNLFIDESPYSYITLKCAEGTYIWSSENSRTSRHIRLSNEGDVEFLYGGLNNAESGLHADASDNVANVQALSLSLQKSSVYNHESFFDDKVPSQLVIDNEYQTSLLKIAFSENPGVARGTGYLHAQVTQLSTSLPKVKADDIDLEWHAPVFLQTMGSDGGVIDLHYAVSAQETQAVVLSTLTFPTGVELSLRKGEVLNRNSSLYDDIVEIKPDWPAGKYTISILATDLKTGKQVVKSKSFFKRVVAN